MIKLECKNKFLNRYLSNLLIQKKLISSKDSEDYFSSIYIIEHSRFIDLNINKVSKKIMLPIDINQFHNKILEGISEIEIKLGKFLYFPYQRIIKNNINKKIYLSDVQNIILSNLILYKKGIDKFDLYNLIWSNDKNISINKLDTHLTNLKIHLNSSLSADFNFQSNNKILNLIIN